MATFYSIIVSLLYFLTRVLLAVPLPSEPQSGHTFHHTGAYANSSIVDRKVVDTVRLSRHLQQSNRHEPPHGQQAHQHERFDSNAGVLRFCLFGFRPGRTRDSWWSFDLVSVFLSALLTLQRTAPREIKKDCKWRHRGF